MVPDRTQPHLLDARRSHRLYRTIYIGRGSAQQHGMTPRATQISRLRILATSDVHMHLLPYDYLNGRAAPGTGLAALLATITDLHRKAGTEEPPRETLLVDNGDTLQGTALGDHLAETLADGTPHPVAEVMNEIGYDVMGLGNHDLDYGLDHLARFARTLDAPLVCSNIAFDPPRDWIAPTATIDVGGLRVGVLSVLPPRTVVALHAQIGGFARATDMVEAVTRAAQTLRDGGADIILGLGHTGLGSDGTEAALAEIAATGAVDALIGGHDHSVFPGDEHAERTEADVETGMLHKIPTVMPGFAAAGLGCIDLDLERDDRGRWAVTAGRARVFPPSHADGADDPAFDPIRPAHDATCAALDEIIGSWPVPLTSYFAHVTPTPIHALTAAAQHRAIDRARVGTPVADLPLLSAVSVPRAGGKGGAQNYADIPAGQLTARHMAELSIYSNYVWAVQVSGAEIAEWLEKSASAFATICEDGAKGIRDADFPSFEFDVIHGLDYTVDPTLPPRYDRAGNLSHAESRRIRSLTHAGAPVEPDMQFAVAVNSFRACGGGNFPGLHPDRPVLRPKLFVTDVIREFLTSGEEPYAAGPWRFAGTCAGMRTWFDTGPGALNHLHEIAHLSPGTPEHRPSGFVRIPITL